MRAFLVLLAVLALAPAAAAQRAPDFVVTIDAEGNAAYEGPDGWLTLLRADPLERYAWDLALPQPAYGEVRWARGTFDVDRERQVQPTVQRGNLTDPFDDFGSDRVWEAAEWATVARLVEEGGAATLRLRIPATNNSTLNLTRDVDAPRYSIGEFREVTPHGFYVETRTNELARGDLQVRAVGAQEWIQNPTPALARLQRFPIIGLDADTEHEVRFVFTDWSGNEVTSPVLPLRTPALPAAAPPDILALAPAPNDTVEAGEPVVVEARVLAEGAPLPRSAVRLFVDLQEHREFSVENGTLRADLGRLAPGEHVVSVEAVTPDGGAGSARWRFTVASSASTPAPGAAWVVAGVAGLALVLRRRR